MKWQRTEVHVAGGIQREAMTGICSRIRRTNTGFRQYSLAVKDLQTGKLLPDHAERVGSVVWANDSKTIFYTVEDDTTKRQIPGCTATPRGRAVPTKLAYEEKDEKFDVYAASKRAARLHRSAFRKPYDRAKLATFPPANQARPSGRVMQPAQARRGILPGSQRKLFLYPGSTTLGGISG